MEVKSLVTELDQRPGGTTDLPESPVPGLEPLLTITQLCEWTGYSRPQIGKLRARREHPLPTLGTEQRPRFLPSEVLVWMREESARTAKS